VVLQRNRWLGYVDWSPNRRTYLMMTMKTICLRLFDREFKWGTRGFFQGLFYKSFIVFFQGLQMLSLNVTLSDFVNNT
jgi:hypothetical protein